MHNLKLSADTVWGWKGAVTAKRKRDGQTWLSRELPVTAADRFADLAHDIQTAPPGVSTLVRTETERERISRLSR